MTTPEIIAGLDRIRDGLAEARRGMSGNRQEAERALNRVHGQITDILRLVPMRVFWRLHVLDRVRSNLVVASHVLRSAPSVAEGYIDGASYELLRLRGQLLEDAP